LFYRKQARDLLQTQNTKQSRPNGTKLTTQTHHQASKQAGSSFRSLSFLPFSLFFFEAALNKLMLFINSPGSAGLFCPSDKIMMVRGQRQTLL
jgi:hypothetical protein